MARVVRCPTCGAELEWSDAFPFRPFCSERCKLVDLARWVDGDYRISGEPVPADPGPGDPATSEP